MTNSTCDNCPTIDCRTGLRVFLAASKKQMKGKGEALGAQMDQLARCLNTHLSDVLALTLAEVNYRHDVGADEAGRFRLNRLYPCTELPTPGSEAELERRLYNHYFDGVRMFPPICEGIVSYQVPLGGPGKDKGPGKWGKSDLLGFSEVEGKTNPVVLEVKRADNSENPFETLLQAVSYAFAIRENWNHQAHNRFLLRDEWTARVKQATPHTLESCASLCIAPIDYWKAYKGAYHGSRASIEALRHSLAMNGLPVHFAAVDVETLALSPLSPWDLDD